MIGQHVLNYTIDSLLGEGGMGSVYLATHRQLGRKVAIKVLNPGLAKNPEIRERFKNEAATLSKLHHPNIVTLYDFIEEDEALYLIMEHVEGISLDAYIHTISGPVPALKAIPLFLQIVEAFAYAHEQGVIHRDAKPANMMLKDTGRVKILDFGIAKLVNEAANLKLTRTGVKVGSVLYMSPEQVKAQPVDVRSDVYCLGVTFFELLTGCYPYGNELTEFEVYYKIVHDPLPAACEIYPAVWQSLQEIIDKATAKNPDERYQNAREMKDALEEVTIRGEIEADTWLSQPRGIVEPEGIAKEKEERVIDFPTQIPMKGGFSVEDEKDIPGPAGFSENPASQEKRKAYFPFERKHIAATIGTFVLLLILLMAWITSGSQYSAGELQGRVNNFYKAVEARNFNSLKDFYASKNIRYYKYKDLSLGQLEEVYKNYWKFTPDERHSIDWNVFTYRLDEEGNYLITFPLTYRYKRANSDQWQQTKAKTIIKMNKDLEIFYLGGR